MRLFDFVQQNDGVGLTADLLGQLTTFFIAYVSGRRSDQARYSELLHVFAHVDADECIFRVKEIPAQYFGKLGFTDTGRAKEDESADWFIWVFQASTVALNGFYHFLHSIVLTNHFSFQFIRHTDQAGGFRLCDTCNRDAAHHGHDIGHVIEVHGIALGFGFFLPGTLGVLQLLDQLFFGIAQTSSLFVFLTAHHAVLFRLDIRNLVLEIDDVLRNVDIRNVHAGTCFVQGIDGLIR